MEKELNTAKQFNKAAMVIIIILQILMSIMIGNMRNLTEQYKQLELKYEELYKEKDEDNKRSDDKNNNVYLEDWKTPCIYLTNGKTNAITKSVDDLQKEVIISGIGQ